MKGRDEQARRSLARVLRNDPDSQQVNEELAEIAANLHHERSIGSTSYIDCFREPDLSLRACFRCLTRSDFC